MHSELLSDSDIEVAIRMVKSRITVWTKAGEPAYELGDIAFASHSFTVIGPLHSSAWCNTDIVIVPLRVVFVKAKQVFLKGFTRLYASDMIFVCSHVNHVLMLFFTDSVLY